MLPLLLALAAIPAEPDLPTRLPAAMMAQVQAANGSTSPTPADPVDVSLVAGASISNLDSTHQASPFVDLVANFPIPGGVRFRGEVEGTFTGSPGPAGSSLSVQDVAAFQAVQFQASAHFIIGGFKDSSLGRTSVGLAGGVTARFSENAANKSPGHGEVFLEVAKKDHTASFKLKLGFTNETGDAATYFGADGRVTLAGSMRVQVAVVAPFANAPSNWYALSQRHDISVAVAVGFDLDHLFTAKAGS